MIAIAPIGTRPFASLAEPSVPPSGLTLAALEQLMRLLQELATAFPETQGWMKARIGSSGDDIQAYQRLIRESADVITSAIAICPGRFAARKALLII